MVGAGVTEDELDAAVRRLLAEMCLYGHHSHDSRREAPGWPDWVIVGTGVLYRELKSARGVLSAPQTRVRDALRHAGQDWGVWRPADLVSGRVGAELAAVA